MKIFKSISLIISMFIINMNSVAAADITQDSFCFKTSAIWQFVGYGLFALKIAVPLIIIVFGIIDFAKAVTSSDDNAIKKSAMSLFKRLIVGIVIFFVPTIINLVFNLIDNVADLTGIDGCRICLLDPNDGVCEENIIEAEEDRKENNQVIINEPQIQPEDEDDGATPSGGGSTNPGVSGSTYTSTKNGIKYNLYYQNDARWGNTRYPDGVTITARGCMISAIAVVSSAYNGSVTPLSVFNTSNRHNHPHYAIESMTNSNFDCYESSNRTASFVSSELNKGNVAVVMVYGSSNGGSSKFTGSQHYMALLDISGNRVYVGNGYGSGSYATTGWYSLNDVLTSVQYVAICEPKFS